MVGTGEKIALMTVGMIILIGAIAITDAVIGAGTTNYIPLWTTNDTINNSIMYQDNTSTTVTVNGSINVTYPNKINGLIICDNGTGIIITNNESLATSLGC